MRNPKIAGIELKPQGEGYNESTYHAHVFPFTFHVVVHRNELVVAIYSGGDRFPTNPREELLIWRGRSTFGKSPHPDTYMEYSTVTKALKVLEKAATTYMKDAVIALRHWTTAEF